MMKNSSKIVLVIEYAYLLTAVFCIVVGVIKTPAMGIEFAWVFYLLAFISMAMFLMKRLGRKNKNRGLKRD